MKKFEFTGEEKSFSAGRTVHRICALIDIPNHSVKAGDVGGFLEFEANLSHTGSAWVANEAIVCDRESVVFEDALVFEEAFLALGTQVSGDSLISGKARLLNSILKGTGGIVTDEVSLEDVLIEGNSVTINEQALVKNLIILGLASDIHIGGNAKVINTDSKLQISGKNMTIVQDASLINCSQLSGNTIMLRENCMLKNGVRLSGKTIDMCGVSSIEGAIEVGNNVFLSECVHIYNDQDVVQRIHDIEVAGDIRATPELFQQ
jgi:hypothetical protein